MSKLIRKTGTKSFSFTDGSSDPASSLTTSELHSFDQVSAFKMAKRITAEPFLVLSTAVYVSHTLTMPQLVIELVCQRVYNSSVCSNLEGPNFITEQDAVHQTTAFWMAALLICSLGPSIVTIFIWGPVGDLIGRSKVMRIPPVFMFLQSAVYLTIALRMEALPHPGLLLIGSFLSCVYGESQGIVALANSYMADISVAEGRTLRIGILESCMFIAISISSLLCGFVLAKFGYSAVFVMTGILSVFNFIYVSRFLKSEKEMVTTEKQIPFDDGAVTVSKFSSDMKASSLENEPDFFSNVLRFRSRVWDVISGMCTTKIKKKLVMLLAAFVLAVIPSLGEIMLGVLFVKHYPFNFQALDIGIFASIQSAMRSVAVIVTYLMFIYWLKFSDYFIIILGLVFQVVYYVLVGLARSSQMLYIIQILGMMMPLPYPAIRSAISKQVDKHHHGSILALTESVDALSALATSLFANTIYAATVSLYSGFFSFLLALSSAGSLVVISILYHNERKISKRKNSHDERSKLINSVNVVNGYVPTPIQSECV